MLNIKNVNHLTCHMEYISNKPVECIIKVHYNKGISLHYINEMILRECSKQNY